MRNFSGLRVCLAGGGFSAEREVSLSSSVNALSALESLGCITYFLDIKDRNSDAIKEKIKKFSPDLVFIALHGEFGEDGGFQSILEEINMPYTGSGPRAGSLAMNKVMSKKIFIKNDIPTAVFSEYSFGEDLPPGLRYPFVVKPSCSGSSFGVSVVLAPGQIKKALESAFSYSQTLLIEDYIEGRELSVGVVGDEAMEVVEIEPESGYYDYNAKYHDDKTRFICPAALPADIYLKCKELSLRSHRVLGCRHFSRVDLRLDKSLNPYVLEVNTIPGLTPHSLLPISSLCFGLDFNGLIATMLELALSPSFIKRG